MSEDASEAAPSIPVIDLAELVHHDRAVRAATAQAIRTGFGEFGLVYLANHGVDVALRDRLFDQFVAFTDRPEAEKEPLNAAKIWFQRGWTPPNTERAVVAGGQPDFKECYFAAPVPTESALSIEYPEICADNVWPDGPDSDFARDYQTLGHQLHEAGLSLLQGVAMAMGLVQRTFDRRLEGAPHVFRLLRYLPLNEAQIEQRVLWGEEHTDFNLLTLLPGGRFLDPDGAPCARPDEGSGLYLRTRSGEKVRGVAPEGCIVAQVGQQLEILTGGALLATPHVVTAPRTPGYTRVSGAHFLHLHPHEMVFPLEPFRTEEAIRAYSPPVLAGTYSMKTLVDIGLAPPTALDGLGYRHYGRLADLRAEESPKA
ncbi:MAG: isopenicillin N synthase family oxygenase [Sandaracinaceae bacterium]|nr:isopenicillin N synthase family oxygenase [Sandaracinaceae bacterium]